MASGDYLIWFKILGLQLKLLLNSKWWALILYKNTIDAVKIDEQISATEIDLKKYFSDLYT